MDDETTTYNFILSKKLLKRFREKDAWISLPDKLRRLIQRYVDNEIELRDEKNSNP